MKGDALARAVAWTAALALVALPFVAVLNGWLASTRWPVRQIAVKAEFRQLDAAEVRAAVQPLLAVGFFAVQPDAVRAAVATLPWVERVEVRKRWPDLIELVVHERHAFARWGDDRLVSRSGELFDAAGATGLESLPRLDGPDERVAEVVAFYSGTRAEVADSGLVVSGVRLSPRGGWRMELESGMRIDLGREKSRARLRRFLDVWPRLAGSHAEPPLSVDLRYENGFAMRWAPPPGADAGKGVAVLRDGHLPAAVATRASARTASSHAVSGPFPASGFPSHPIAASP